MNELLAMGFEHKAVTSALEATGNDIDRAIDILLGSSANDNNNEMGSMEQVQSTKIIELEISQYAFEEAGTSACTAIAASVMTYLLGHSRDTPEEEISRDRICDAVLSGIMKYNEVMDIRGSRHLAVDELGETFFHNTHPIGPGLLQGLLTEDRPFEKLFRDARAHGSDIKPIGIIITKPPETIAVILPPAQPQPGGRNNLFILFDSHPRPQETLFGAYLLESTKESDIVQHLHRLFPGLALSGLDSGVNQMYNMFEANLFQLN